MIRYLAALILAAGAANAQTGAPTAAPSTSKADREKAAYAIGYDIGGRFKRDAIEVDPNQIAAGVRDGLAGKKPAYEEAELRGAIQALDKQMDAKRQESVAAMLAKNKQAGDAFRANFAKQPGVKTLPSGLQYKVLAEGKGKKPAPGESVTCHYKGTLIDGTEFDSSYSRNEPAKFKSDQVIKGWQEALPLMAPGAKWQLAVPPELAYGDRGAPPRIQPGSTLLFDVELLSVP